MTDLVHRRLPVVVLAPLAALTTWAIARLLGVDLVLKSERTVGAVDVVAAALIGAMAGWLVVRLLERHTRNPRAAWPLVGSTALAASTIGPTWLADGTSAVALIMVHVVTGVVVIAGFARTLPCRDCGLDLRRPKAESHLAG